MTPALVTKGMSSDLAERGVDNGLEEGMTTMAK